MADELSKEDSGREGAPVDKSSLKNLAPGRSMGQVPAQDEQGRSAPDTYPAEDAALPGRRNAQRLDASGGTGSLHPRFGGEGDGRRDRQTPLGPDTNPSTK